MTAPTPCPTCGAPLRSDAPGGACPRCLLEAGFATVGGPTDDDRVPTPEELAPTFPGLVIETLLGRGGMGVVYKARHKALDRDVALKVLPARVARDRAFADRFQREARALAKLQHPNIVGVHDFGETDGLFWLVMEYVDGANIRQAMRAGQIGPKEALAIVPQICDALQYAHEHGVVHRDIKPENVMLDTSGRVKVADFGLAKLMATGDADRRLTGAGQVMGTPHYMAPEQWERPNDVDHRADIYSLGVVFYEMLTGELPVGRFAAPSRKSDVDARIDEIVMRTLEREREARYQRADDVKTDVGAATGGRAATPPAAAALFSPQVIDAGAAPVVPPHRRLAVWAVAFLLVDCIAACWLAWDASFGVLGAALYATALHGRAGLRRMHIGHDAARLDAEATRRRLRGSVGLCAVLVGVALWGAASAPVLQFLEIVMVVNVITMAGLLLAAYVRLWSPWVLLVWFALVSGPVAVVAQQIARSTQGRKSWDFEMAADAPSMGAGVIALQRAAIETLLWELTAVHGTAAVERTYHIAGWQTIQALPPDVRASRGRDGILGLPLMTPPVRPEALAAYRTAAVRDAHLVSTSVGTLTGTAVLVLRGNSSTLLVPLVRAPEPPDPAQPGGARVTRWYFAVGPVEIRR